MKILVTGASGTIGTTLLARLRHNGHVVSALVRRTAVAEKSEIEWDPYAGKVDLEKLEGFDAVIHLAGANIAGRRWNAQYKRIILESRTIPTRFLAGSLARLRQPPAVFLSASGINAYGHRGDELLTESSSRGAGFLADVCREWEDAALQFSGPSRRVIVLRIGAVLDPSSGALAKMIPYFRKGLGAVVGSGRQFAPWISLHDCVSAIEHLLTRNIFGPVNIVAPQSVSQRQFALTLARVLHKRLMLRVPAPLAKIAFGEMAQETILSSNRATPEILVRSNFTFDDPDLEAALEKMLSK